MYLARSGSPGKEARRRRSRRARRAGGSASAAAYTAGSEAWRTSSSRGSSRSWSTAPRIPSSGSSSRTRPGGGSAASPGWPRAGGSSRSATRARTSSRPGRGCGVFAEATARARARMLIGEQGRSTELWEAARRKLPAPREDRPGQPVFAIARRRRPARRGCGRRGSTTSSCCCRRARQAHEVELGIDPLERDADGFRWRTRAQIEEGRSWLWREDGVILFKAEASAWTPSAVQLQQVWVDPAARGQGFARPGAARPDPAAARARRRASACSCARTTAGDPAVRQGRDGPRARLPERSAVRTLVVARHGESEFSLEAAHERRSGRSRAR